MATRRLHPGQKIPKPQFETFVTASKYFLSLCNFVECQKYALRARQSDSTHPAPPRLLSIASVLSSPTISETRPDYCSILNLPHFESNVSRIKSSCENLTSILNPHTNPYPFASEAFNTVVNAWSVLSNRIEKARFDEELRMILGCDTFGSQGGTFWTMCPYCYYVYEYEKVFEECCIRCSNTSCRRGFHAFAILAQPPAEIIEKGQYLCHGFMPFCSDGSGGDGSGSNFWSPFSPRYPGFMSNGGDSNEDDCNGNSYIIDISDEETEVKDHGTGKKSKIGGDYITNGGSESGFMGSSSTYGVGEEDFLNLDENGYLETAIGGEIYSGVKSEIELFEGDDDVLAGFQCDVDLGDSDI